MKKAILLLVTSILTVSLLSGCGVKSNVQPVAAAKTEDTKAKIAPKEASSKIDKIYGEMFGADKFSGYVYVVKDNSVILDKGYGKADFEKGTPNTKETKFDIASLTKQFTSLAIMELQEKKLLNVNDTIDKYLPLFPHGNEITIHHLLTHTAGLARHPETFDMKKFRPSNKIEAAEAKAMKIDFSCKPGAAYSYSSTGYMLLGYIIEKVSGKTLDTYFKENIFQPLDMKNTGFKDETFHITNLAIGYASEKKDIAETGWNDANVGVVQGSSGLCSTVEDLIKWEKALTEEKLISKDSYKKMYTPCLGNYGYGWFLYHSSENQKVYEHAGSAEGYQSYLYRNLDNGTVIIVVSNFGSADLSTMMRITNDSLQ